MNMPNEAASTEDFEFAALSAAVNYRNAIISEFSSFLKGRILEIGAGIGQTSEAILALSSVTELVGLEPETRFHKDFKERLPNVRLLGGTTVNLDHTMPFDAAVMVNVLEHIEDDVDELKRLKSILSKNNGYLCILVPARQEIYSKLDSHFGHFRRYSRQEVRQKMENAGFQPIRVCYFNFIGYFAWALRFRIMGSMSFDVNQVRLFDKRIFPPAHWLESRLCRPPLGQSVLAIAKA